MLHRIYGGVHPHDRKQATRRKETALLSAPPARVILPMSMHVGAPCKPIVAVGDHVLLGQKIAEPAGLGAPIHASVSGTVTAVEPRPHAGGGKVLSVVIENDFQDTCAPALERPAPPEELSSGEIIELIGEAGIVGMGGAGFPTRVKLLSAVGQVDTLIINGAECEPWLTADHRLMLEDSARIVGGVKLLMRVLGLSAAVIGVEANKPDGVAALRAAIGAEDGIRVAVLKTRFPQGAEKQLIQSLTGRQVPPGKLPADVKCAVFNVATVAAVYDAVYEGRPLTRRIVTVTGGAVVRPRNLLVPLGTPISVLVEQCGGLREEPGRVLFGGPMMGIAQYTLEVPTMKGTNGITCMLPGECSPVPGREPTCIRCGRCVKACPMHLTPLYFYMYGREGRFKELEGYRIGDCIECGSCSYTCPAHIRLVQMIRTGKNELRRRSALEQERRAAVEKMKADEAGKEGEKRD